jgi:Phage-related minor tail protein
MDRFGLSAQFDFNSGNSSNQITGVSNSIAGLIDTIQDLEKAVGSSDNFGKKIAKQLDFAPKKTQMRGVAKDVEAIGTAATNTKKSLSPLKDEFRAIRAESRNIDLGDLGDDKQYKKGRAELIAYTKSLKMLQAQTKGNSTAEREFNASLVAGEKAAKNKLEIMESQRKALSAAQKVGVSGAAVVIGKAAIDPVKQFATDSMKILEEFDDKMAAVAAVVQPTTEQLKGLRKQAAALGASTRYDAAQAAEAMGELGSAGFTTQQIMIGIGDTLSLASAGALGLAEAAEISASSLNGFGMEVNQLGHVVDVFAIAAAKTNAGIQDIGETMKYAAPSAALFGATIEETTALIGTLANAGIKGSSSGTALRSMFTRLASPTGPAQAALDSMGVKVKDAKGKLRNIMEIMDDLQVKMGLNSEDLSKQKAFFQRIAASGENVDEAIAKLKKSGDKQADNIETIKTLIGAEAMGGFSTALQNNAKTKQAVYAEMAGSYDQNAFNQVLMQTTAENKNFDELRAAFADKSASGQEKFKKIDIFKYVSEATASYSEAAGLINNATDGLAIQGASTVVGDDLKLVQKTLASFKDSDEQFAEQFKDVDFSSFGDGVDLLQALVKGTGDTKKGAFQLQAALKASGVSVAAFTGAGKNMADVKENSLAGDIRNMESAIDSLRLNSIEPFEPLIRGVIKSIGELASFLANMPEPIRIAIGALQMLVFALGAVLVAGGSIGIIMFGFEQAAATAAIATTVLEGSTIALTGFFGTSLSAAAGVNPLTASLSGLRTTASTLFAPLTALKTLMFELGRAMMAQMMSPLGLTLIGLSALYLIFEALTPQFDVLGRLMGTLAAPFGFLYGFAKGIGKALMTLIAPLVKIGTVAAGFPFVSVAKSLAMAVDYFGQFATKGEAAGVAFVDYFAAPIVMAATMIAAAWSGAIGNIQSYMDGLVSYALNIAQLLINALNHNPTVAIPNSWDGAVERITAGLQGLIPVARMVASAMIAAFDFVVGAVANLPLAGEWAANKARQTASEFHDYLDTQLDFDVAGVLIAQFEAGESKLSDYIMYFGKTFLPGLIATYMAGPLSQYFNKFSELAASFTGLKYEDIINIEEFNIDETLKSFDRIKENAESLYATFTSGRDLIAGAFYAFSDPNNTANIFVKTMDLIVNSIEGVKIAAGAVTKAIGLVLGGTLISILPTVGVGIKLITMAIQFVFKTIDGIAIGTISLLAGISTGIGDFGSTIADFRANFDLTTFFNDSVGAIDRVTTALGDNLNVLSLFALVGSTLPLGFVFSKGMITKELFNEIPAFYKAFSLLLPAGMGTLIASGLSTELVLGLGEAIKNLGAGLLDSLGIALDWYGLMKIADFNAAIDTIGQKFEEAKTAALSFGQGIYDSLNSIQAFRNLMGILSISFQEIGIQLEYLNIGIRYVFDLLKSGFDISGFHVSIVDLLGLDIAIKAAQGLVRVLALDSFKAMLGELYHSLIGVIATFETVARYGAAIGKNIFQNLLVFAKPPLFALLDLTKSILTAVKTAAIDTGREILSVLRSINPEFYDMIAGQAKKGAAAVVAKKGAIAAAIDAQIAGEAVVEAIAEAEAVQKLSAFGKFLALLAKTPLKILIPTIVGIADVIKQVYAFPFVNLASAVGFLRSLPYATIINFAKAMGSSLYETFGIVRFLSYGIGNLIKDAGKAASFIANFGAIYAKTQGLSTFGIKAITPIDILLAGVKGLNSELSKVSLKKLYMMSGSLEFQAGTALELGNILKNFGIAQKAALLPGVLTYIAAWGGAGLVIYPVLKGIFKMALIGLGMIGDELWNKLTHIDWRQLGIDIGMGILRGMVFAFEKIFEVLGYALEKAFTAIFPQLVYVIESLKQQWEGLEFWQKIMVAGAGVLAGGILFGIVSGMTTVGQVVSTGVAIATSSGFRMAMMGLATGVLPFLIKNRDAIYQAVVSFVQGIPGFITAAFEALKTGFVEIASTALAIMATIGIMALFMGQQIKMIIATAFSSVGDSAKAVNDKLNPIGKAYEKVRQVRSDRKVDKDRTDNDKEYLALSASNNGLARGLIGLLNKTGKTNIEIVPEYERASRLEKMPRRAELNLLDRQVQKLAEQNLKERKVKGETNGRSGLLAKFSTAQLESESAAIFANEKLIRKAAFAVAGGAEANYQTQKNIRQKAIEQLTSDPTVQSAGKKGKYSNEQIQAEEAKIKADKSQMAVLSVGKVFTDLAKDMSLAGSETLRGLGQEQERQKFIDSGALVDEDLTIKAKNVELFVSNLNLEGIAKGEGFGDKQKSLQAALIVANQRLASGVRLKDLGQDLPQQRSSIEGVYKSFSQMAIRPNQSNDNAGVTSYGKGNSVPSQVLGILNQSNDYKNDLRNNPALNGKYRSVLKDKGPTVGVGMTNTAGRFQGNELTPPEVDRYESEAMLRLKELGLVAIELNNSLPRDPSGLDTRQQNEQLIDLIVSGDNAIDPHFYDGSTGIKPGGVFMDAADLRSRMPDILAEVYGADLAGVKDRARQTGSYAPDVLGTNTADRYQGLADIELLQQAVVDLIGQLRSQTPEGQADRRNIPGKQMAMVSKLFVGFKEELNAGLSNMGMNPDGVIANKLKDSIATETSLQAYGMEQGGVKPGDVQYDSINESYESERQRLAQAMTKDFQFFSEATTDFMTTVSGMGVAAGENPFRSLDLLTSPDLVNDENFAKLSAGVMTDLPEEIHALLTKTIKGMTERADAITPNMRKDIVEWQKPAAQKAAAMARMVGLNVNDEVGAGLTPAELATKAAAVREQMGFALKSFMSLAIPSNQDIKLAMARAYEDLGVGNTIDWAKVLPLPKGAEPVANADRYQAIAASFNRMPQQLANKKLESSFMDKLVANVQMKEERGSKESADAILAATVKDGLFGGSFQSDQFDPMVKQLGLEKELRDSSIVKEVMKNIADGNVDKGKEAKVLEDAKLYALGQAFLKRNLATGGAGGLSALLTDGNAEDRLGGFYNLSIAMVGKNQQAPTGKKDLNDYMGRLKGSLRSNSIEAALYGMVNSGEDPAKHAEQIRTAAVLIANGQLDLLEPGLLMAVSRYTKNSVASLIQPNLDQENTGKSVDKVQVNVLRRLEIQRRLQAKGVDTDAFEAMLGEKDADRLYKGQLGSIGKEQKAQQSQKQFQVAEILNPNGKKNNEAVVEMMASLSQQTLLVRHQESLSKQQRRFFKDSKRSDQFAALEAEAQLQRKKDAEANAYAQKASQRRKDKLMSLIIAQDPNKFEELSNYGLPRQERNMGNVSYSTDPQVDKLVGGYNYHDILKQIGDSPLVTEDGLRTLIGKMFKGESFDDQTMMTKLNELIVNLGLTNQQFANIDQLDLTMMLDPVQLKQVDEILFEMKANDGKRLRGGLDSEIGVGNKARRSAARLESLLMHMAPSETVKATTTDPKQARASQIDKLLEAAGIKVNNEENKPRLADNLYKNVIAGAKMPLDGVIANLKTAQKTIKSGLSQSESVEPEVVKFMTELANVESELEAAVANKTSPIAALAKLIGLQNRSVKAKDGTTLAKIAAMGGGVPGKSVLGETQLFGEQNLPKKLVPEMFDSVRTGTGADTKMMAGLGSNGVDLTSSSEYQLATLAAQLDQMTDGYQVHNKKLMALRQKFIGGADDFFGEITKEANMDLFKATAEGLELFEALEKLYAHASIPTNNINLSGAGLSAQLDAAANIAAPENLGVSARQLELLQGFANRDQSSSLTLDPSIANAQSSLGKGEVLSRKQLANLKYATAAEESDLEFFINPPPLTGTTEDLFRPTRLQGLSADQKVEANLSKQNVQALLKDTIDFEMQANRKLVESIEARGVAAATSLGEAVAAEYSVLYAYANSETNTIDFSPVKGMLDELNQFNVVELAAKNAGVDTGNGIKALKDILEGRRTTIEKFNDNERKFLAAFLAETGLSQKQLFNLESAIPKTTPQKILAIGPQMAAFYFKRYQKIKIQKDNSLNKFLKRSGLDYEQLTEILKQQGFNALQIQKIYMGHGKERQVQSKVTDKAQVKLIGLLAKYGGMSKKDAKNSIVSIISKFTGADKDGEAQQLQEFIETEIKKQKYSKRVEAKILAYIKTNKSVFSANKNRYADAASTGLLLSERLGTSTSQIKKLASLMGVDLENFNKSFTDKGGILGELAYAGDYFQIAKEAFDPLNLNKQLARIFSGTKLGDGFAAEVEKITAKRTAKLYDLGGKFKLSMLLDPVVGSLLRKFKTPAEAVLDKIISVSANSSDWLNKNLAGRIAGANGTSKFLLGVESKFRELKHKGSNDLDNMPGIGKSYTAFKAKMAAIRDRVLGRSPSDPDVAQGEFVDAAAPDPASRGGIGGVVDAVTQAPAKIQSTIQRSLTVDGAVKNIAAIAKLTVNNPLNQGIRDLRKEIGTRMFKSATEAIDLTAATAIVATRSEDGVRTYINEQRNPLRALQKNIGQFLIDFDSPMGNLYKAVGFSLVKLGDLGVSGIELIEQGLNKSRSNGFADKLSSMGRQARDLIVAGLGSMGEAVAVTFGGSFDGTSILPALDKLKQNIQSTIGILFGSIGQAFELLTGVSSSMLSNVLGSLLNSIKGVFNRFRAIGRKVMGVEAKPPGTDPANNPPATGAAGLVPDGANPVDNSSAIAPSPENSSVQSSSEKLFRFGRRRTRDRFAVANPNLDMNDTDAMMRARGLDPTTGLPPSDNSVPTVLRSDIPSTRQPRLGAAEDLDRFGASFDPLADATGTSGVESVSPLVQNPVVQPDIVRRARLDEARRISRFDPTREVSRNNKEARVQQMADQASSPDIIDAEIVPQPKTRRDYDILDEGINAKIEENWAGTSDSIIKDIKHIALVSKKLGYWIMRNLSEGSPGPTYYMRQHYGDTTDFIEADLRRLVTVAQRSGSAIQAGLAGEVIDLNFADLPKATNMAVATANPTVDDEFTGAVAQAEQFQSANVAAANLAANAAVVQDHTQNTADAMMDVAKGEVKVDQKGKKLFKFFNLMWKAMKIVPKGFVKMGQVFKKIGAPVMMMGAGFSAAGFAIQNISSNLSTLGIVNEQQSEMIQKGSAVMEIFGGIGAIGGAALQVLTGGFAFLLEAGVGVIALALNPVTYAVLGIGAAVIAGIFALNWLSKTFLGFDFIAPVFGGIEGSMTSLWSFLGEKLTPMIGFVRFQFAQAFGYDALGKLDGAIAWLGNAWNAGFAAIGNGLKWLQGMMTEASTHISGVVGVLAIVFAPLFAVGWLTYKLFEALFNAIAPGLVKLMPVLDELALRFQAAFGSTIDRIVGAWTGGLDKIGGMMVGLWQLAEQVGNWLIGSLNCNPTVQIPLAWQGATDNIMGMMNYLPDHAKATADKMVGFFGKAFDWLGGKKPEDIESKVGLTKTTTESTIVDPATGVVVPTVPTAVTPVATPIVTLPTPAMAVPAMPDLHLPDWMNGIGSFATEKMASFGISAPASPDAPLPVDPTGSLDAAKGVQSALTSRSADIGSRKGLLLHAGAEHKSERMDAAASGIGDLVSQSEYLQAEYQDLANPQGWKKQLAWFDKLFGSTQKRTKEIITQRGEIEKTLKTVVEGAKADLSAPIGGDLLVRLGVDPDALDTAGTEIQAGITSLGEQMVAGIQEAVAPAATYWDDAMTSIAEVGVGGTAEAIFGHALYNISEGVGTCGMAFKDLGGEVFESLKTMDFKRMANAGKMFTSTMGEGLGQIARGFQDAANGAAFFAAFSVTSGFLPALIFGGLVLLLVYLTLKFGNLREIASGAFQVISGAAKVFLVALQSIKPIVERLGDVFKGMFAAMKGDFNPLKTAITNLRLEFGIMFAKMGPGFAQIKDGLAEMKKGFQPVIDEGILPMIENIKAAFGRLADFFLDPFRKAIADFRQFGVDLAEMAANIVKNVQAEFSEVFSTIGGAAKFAFESVQGFFDDFGRGIRNIIDIVATTIADIGSIFTTGIADITGAFKAAWEGIGIGATGIEGIGRGIKLVAGEVANLGGNILSSLGGATEGIRSEIGKVGASFIETNQDLFASLQTGFDQIGQLFPNLFKIFSDGVNDFTAYFTVKFQGIIDFVTGIFDGIGKVAGKAWELASSAFGKFNDLTTVGIAGIQAFADEQFGKIGEVFGGIGDKGKAAFDHLLLAAQPMTDGLKAIFTGTVQDLDNLVQSGLDSFNGMTAKVATGFSDAFTSIKTTGADLSANLIAIPSRIGTAFADMTGLIGSTLMNEFESAKTSGSELLDALKGSFADGTNQIGVMISGITTSFATVGDSITATIENLKATFSGLGEAIDTAMGSAFGGVKEKWQKTTGFMGKLMGKVAGDSEETGQLILHNMAENSPGPTQRIRERYAYTADSVNHSLETIAAAAEVNGAAIADSMNPVELARMEQRMNEAAGTGSPVPTAANPSPALADATGSSKAAVGRLGSNVGSSSKIIGSLLEMGGQKDLAGGFNAVASGIDTVSNALGAVKIAKEIGKDFQVLSGVIQSFGSVQATVQLGDMATGLAESGKAAWEAVKGFGQWIMSKLFQTSVAVTAEATTAGAAVAGATATAGANTVVATTNAVAGASFTATASAAIAAWSAILAPIMPIILAIAGLIGIIFLVKAAFDNNFLGFGDLMYGIGDAIGFVWNIFTGFFGALWNGGMEIIGGVFGTLMTTIGEIGGMFTSLGKDLAAPFMELFATIGALFAPIVAMFPQMNGGLSATSMLVNVLLMPFKLIGESLSRTIWLIGMLIKGIVFVAGIVIKILVAPFMSIIKVITGIVGIFNLVRDAVVAIGSAVWSAIVSPFEFVTNLIKGISDMLGSLFSGPLGFLGGVFGFDPKPTAGADVQQFSTGGFVSGAGGPTDDKIPAMLSNGEFVIGAAATARNRTFLEAINAGMPAQEALQLMDVPHPIGELPDRAAVAAGGSAAPAAVTVENHYAITVNFGDIVVQGATGEEAAQDFSRFLQTTEFQMAIQAALAQQVESMR